MVSPRCGLGVQSRRIVSDGGGQRRRGRWGLGRRPPAVLGGRLCRRLETGVWGW